MDRARRLVLCFSLFVVLIAGSGSGAVPLRHGPLAPVAAVTWPVSTLLVGEVVTGGASASDEYIELTNAGASTADLVGLEVVYATSTGTTVTRKASWTATRPLEPGQHLLIANASGTYSALADATYSGGLAATGGAIVLRVIGGAPIDAVGWGDATNAFVEGTVAPAPPARSSLQRRPGGAAGNGIDTNDNAADWSIEGSPIAQNLAATPTPTPTPPPSSTPGPTPAPSSSTPGLTPAPSASAGESLPTPTSTPTPTTTAAPPVTTPPPTATATPAPSVSPAPVVSPNESSSPSDGSTPSHDAQPTPTGAASPTPTVVPTPVATPTVDPTPTLTQSPASTPTAVPSSTPSPTTTPPPVTQIADARSLADGSVVTVEGTLTTDLGALESGRTAFVQDGSGGIAVYLDVDALGAGGLGTMVRMTGTVDSRFSQRTLRVALADVATVGAAPIPAPILVATGAAGENVEGSRVAVSGTVIEAPSALADGTGLLIDDGSGPVRIVVTPLALGDLVVARASIVSVVGPVGQRDSTGAGTAGYRVFVTVPGDIVVSPAASPSPGQTPSATPSISSGPSADPPVSPGSSPSHAPAPSSTATATPGATPIPTPGPTHTPTPTPYATPSPTHTPTPSPTPTPAPSSTADPLISISDARASAIGARVHVRGVVFAEPGRLGTAALFAIADSSGAIVVRLPAGATAPVRGALVDALGPLAAPYGQLEVRPAAGHVTTVGAAGLPLPILLTALDLGESVEARLVAVDVQLDLGPTRAASGDLTVDALDVATGRRIPVMADASSGIALSDLARGRRLHLVGVVGQRATRAGRLDGYRIWLRDRSDIASPATGGVF